MNSIQRTAVLRQWKLDLEAELAKLNRKLAPLESQRADVLGQLNALSQLIGKDTDDSTTTPYLPSVLTKGSSLADAAHELLQRIGRPTHYTDLCEKLVKEGVDVPGQEPKKNLVAHLSRDSRFARTKARGVYALSIWSTEIEDTTHTHTDTVDYTPGIDEIDEDYLVSLEHSVPPDDVSEEVM